MTREAREKRIKELECREFMVCMVDRWTEEDRKNLAKIRRELAELKEDC